jgi:hypothetical protein
MPSDRLVPFADLQTDHAITIAAPPGSVWPWLIQMGWGRAGWYTYRWVDRLLFPRNGPSSDVIIPEHQRLEVGGLILDGPPDTGCHFVVEEADEPRRLVLRSSTHIPPVRDAAMNWVWAYTLEPVSGGTRLHLRSRAAMSAWWLRVVYHACVAADLVMARSHLRGIRLRVESGRILAPETANSIARRPIERP